MTEKALEISLCMGSSCFSRGNNRTLANIQQYIRERGIDASVTLAGALCEGRCKSGPNVTVNGVNYEQVDPDSIADILEYHLNGKNALQETDETA